VRQFVADHDANATHIHGIVHRLVKEWRLQNSSRKKTISLYEPL